MYTVKYPRCREPPHQQLWNQLKYATYTRETKKGFGLDNKGKIKKTFCRLRNCHVIIQIMKWKKSSNQHLNYINPTQLLCRNPSHLGSCSNISALLLLSHSLAKNMRLLGFW